MVYPKIVGSLLFTYSAFCMALCGCKKLVSIPPPDNSITTSQVFSTDQEATEAMAGVYNAMINTGGSTGPYSGSITMDAGASSDEFDFFNTGNLANVEFQNNSLLSNNGTVSSIWASLYFGIYGSNAVLDGLQASSTIDDSVRNELIGEAEFVRAFSNFYLINLFGNIPLVSTINYNKTSLLSRSPTDSIYAAIVSDLKDAQSRLPTDYSAGQGQRIVPNKWVATAMLARVYLYKSDWTDAASEASNIISNTNLYNLVGDLDSVFLANSNEAIWQLQQTNQNFPFNATPEGNIIIPFSQTTQPYLYLTPELLNAFEDSDMRRIYWVDSTIYLGTTYYFPYKYRIGPAQEIPSGIDSQYYMVLRLGEQYLIRAEAEANGAGGGVAAGISDLNVIRNRAGLPNITTSSQSDLLNAIYHERQIELFAEWGQRWLDLKRLGIASPVLSVDKGLNVNINELLYPIPVSELQTDPNLVQNPGYE